MFRPASLLAMAGFIAPIGWADVVFTDPSMNLSSYTQTPVYASSNATVSISNGGGGVEAAVSVSSPNNSPGSGAVGIINNTFTYDPATQGAIQSLSVTKNVSFSTSVAVGPGQTPWSSGCTAMLEQDGKYYAAFTQGPSFNGGGTETFTCSMSGLTAASFTQFDFSTGATASGHPDFAGDPMMFGVLFDVGAAVTVVLTYVDSSLSFDLVTASSPPALNASPSVLSFSAFTGAFSSTQQQIINVVNAGGSTADFTPSAEFKSPWVSVSPASTSGSPGSPVLFTVSVNPQGLSPGSYRDVIQFLGSNAATSVPVALLVTNPNPVLFAGPGGFTFTMVQGAGSSLSQNLVIANQGASGSTLSWSVGAATGPGIPNGNFLSFGESSGQTQAGAASNVPVSLNSNASSLAAGVYYELIQVSASNAQNSPQYSTAVLNVVPPSAEIFPQVTPAGLLFTGAAGATIAPQQFTVNWSSTAFQVIVAAPSTANGQSWLDISPGSGVPASTSPSVFNVSVNTSGLAAGVYTATIQINGGTFGAVNVTLIVTSGAALNATAHARGEASVASCTPSMVVLTETGIPSSFTVPAGWPADLIATMTDDCGSPVNNGAIAANFSDGDPPLALTAQGSAGQYIAVWQPSKETNATITLTGSAPKLATSSIEVAGFVTANKAPVLAPNGILNNLNPLVGAALAPGTVAEAFGTGLTTSQMGVTPGQSPLPNQFDNTELVMAGSIAPLYFLSSTQLDVQIPAEVLPLQQLSAVAIVNNALSLPVTVATVAVAPGVAANADGTVIAQDTKFNLIDAANPAHPGEPVVIYLAGMGATNPPVASGQPAPGLNPGDTLAQAAVQPVVMVNNQTAQILFAGLTPGGIGLYQIDFVVPAGTAAGQAALTVSQGSISANATTLPVAVP